MPEPIDIQELTQIRRKKKLITVPDVYKFLRTLPTSTPQERQNAIVRKYWDVQGNFVRPQLTKQEQTYYKEYARELLKHMKPAVRRSVKEEEARWEFTRKELRPFGHRVRKTDERWARFIAEDDPQRLNRQWLYGLEGLPYAEKMQSAIDRGVGMLPRSVAIRRAIGIWSEQHPERVVDGNIRGKLPMKEIMAIAKTQFPKVKELKIEPVRQPKAPKKQKTKSVVVRPRAPFDVESPVDLDISRILHRDPVARVLDLDDIPIAAAVPGTLPIIDASHEVIPEIITDAASRLRKAPKKKNPWIEFLAQYRASHPGIRSEDAMKNASVLYQQRKLGKGFY